MKVFLSNFILVLCMLSASIAVADEPVIFSRDTITIVPKEIAENAQQGEKTSKPVEEKKAQDAKGKSEESTQAKPREKLALQVNIRPESFLRQPGVFNLQPFMDAAGLLIILDAPRTDALQPNNIFASVDVFFLSADGHISQIAPAITPSDLTEAISTDENAVALLFLKAGEADKLAIKPGDIVEHSLFKAKPVLLRK